MTELINEKAYEFTLGTHNAQAHDYTSALIDAAYSRKGAGNPTTPEERVSNTEELTEAYYEAIGDYPPESVLSRLAWYIVFDEMTDMHPDKITREEYPFMSDHQIDVRLERERSSAEMYTGKDDVTIGRKRGHDGVNRRLYDYNSPERDMSLVPTRYLDLYNAMDSAKLSARQAEAISLVYFEGLTQEAAGRRMGVNKGNVNRYLRNGVAKIRRELTNEKGTI